jgi:hypothetical protein
MPHAGTVKVDQLAHDISSIRFFIERRDYRHKTPRIMFSPVQASLFGDFIFNYNFNF